MKHQLLFVEDGIAIIRLKGELDHHATQLIRDEISESLYRGTLRAIIWNLKDLQFMDSAGIGLILGRMRDFVPTNGQTFDFCLIVLWGRIYFLGMRVSDI